MKRPSRSFVVEVRKQRRPPGEPTLSWAEELQKPQSNAATRAAEPPAAPVAETAVVAPARPVGRILPSLIEPAPPPAPAPIAAKPPKLAKPAKAAKPRTKRRPADASLLQPIRFVEPPKVVLAPPQIAKPAAKTADKDESARHRRILARYVFGDASKPGQRWKRRLRGDAS
jgi:hypothetical protein